MKKIVQKIFTLLLVSLSMGTFVANAQVRVTCKQLQERTQADLANCKDTSIYDGDTVIVTGVVLADANLIDVPSSSVQGGFRPFVHIVDTANAGSSGNFKGLQVMGVYRDAGGNSLPVLDIFNLYAGMQVEIKGVVGSYRGETQLSILDNSSLNVIGNQSKPQPVLIDLGKLNDNTRTNKLETGEEYEGSFVEMKNLTVSAIYTFSGNRTSFDLTDGNGNVINVSDRFMVQKTSSYTTSRTSSPSSQGSFVAPVVGTRFDHIKGIVIHSQNGCTGGTGRGYEINPFDTSHYRIGITPPHISEVVRTPLVPSGSDKVKIVAKIIDFDGNIVNAKLHYTDIINAPASSFTEVAMVLKGGTTDSYEAEMPASAEGKVIRYYITSKDNDDQTSYLPFNANAMTNPNFMFYTVRNNGLTIVDLQKVLNVNNDASPYVGQVVTVTGVVTASTKAYDLESIFIQDETATEWAGIRLEGNSELIKLFRGEKITVTGTVSESFGFTTMAVTNVERLHELKEVAVTILDPSDSAGRASHAIEKYESMLIGYHTAGGKVLISNPRLNGFGEYMVATNENASYGMSSRVQAGIQNSTNSSSLWASIVSDSSLKDNQGNMNVDLIKAQKGMSFDTLIGILYYGFGQYKVLPRNNDDFVGSSVAVPETDYPPYVNSVNDLSLSKWVKFYPNPTENILNIDVIKLGAKNLSLTIVNSQGKTVYSNEMSGTSATIQTENWSSGLYFIQLLNNGLPVGSAKLIKE